MHVLSPDRCASESPPHYLVKKSLNVLISSSPKADKRLKAEFKTKTVHFGQAGGSTFIDHQNERYKRAWIARHKVRGSFSDLQTASALAKGVLWNKPSMKSSIADLNEKQKQYKSKLK